jgi:hypothetical protein
MKPRSISAEFGNGGWFCVVPELKGHLRPKILILANSFKGSLKYVLVGIIYENNHKHAGLKLARSNALFLLGRRAKDINETANGKMVTTFRRDDLA